MTWRDGYIAVDWGTSNRRAYLIDADGRRTDAFADELGLLAVPPGGFDDAVASIRERLGDRPMLLAGMVGSNRGWREAPYVPCPAGADDLAAAILWLELGRTGIVPGVSQTGGSGADVMRGEEVQILGAQALGAIPPDGLICHPGTHAKWIAMTDGRIACFRTMMTGELFALLRTHSILAEQLKQDVVIGQRFRDGVDEGLSGEGLLARLFGIRARHVLGQDSNDAASYASGLLIGSDVRLGLTLSADDPIALIGRPDLCDLYAEAIGRAGRETTRLDGAEAFLAGIRTIVELLG